MRRALCALLLALAVGCRGSTPAPAPAPGPQGPPPVPAGRLRIQVPSTLDGTLQDSYLTLPSSYREGGPPRPLAVLLHTWSNDLEQRQPGVEAEAESRGWLLLTPNFRGRNDRPEACGSPLAQRDILDAVAWVKSRYPVDEKRVYLLGLSGGGFMTMLMASRYPEMWAAGSAWVGISDLEAWYAEHPADNYGAMMRSCYGGAPGDGERVAAVYRERSPLTYLRPGLGIPLDLAAGRDDPTVSMEHTLRAFRALAPGVLPEAETAALRAGGEKGPESGDAPRDPLIDRRIFLRRTAGDVRVTIFDGAHEWFPSAAVEWLARHRRP